MFYYTQFMTRDLTGDVVEALGSDGVFILDGRNRLGTMAADSLERMDKLKAVQPSFVGFRIMTNSNRSFSGGRCIYEFIKFPNNEAVIGGGSC